MTRFEMQLSRCLPPKGGLLSLRRPLQLLYPLEVQQCFDDQISNSDAEQHGTDSPENDPNDPAPGNQSNSEPLQEH